MLLGGKGKMKSINQEKLILSLLVHDITAAVNLAMRLRGITLTLDYSKMIPHLVVTSKLTDAKENWMWANPRTRRAVIRNLEDAQLRMFQIDIQDRLWKMGAQLIFVAEKPYNKKPICKLQIRVTGARQMVLTLADVEDGKVISEINFQTPDGDTP